MISRPACVAKSTPCNVWVTLCRAFEKWSSCAGVHPVKERASKYGCGHSGVIAQSLIQNSLSARICSGGPSWLQTVTEGSPLCYAKLFNSKILNVNVFADWRPHSRSWAFIRISYAASYKIFGLNYLSARLENGVFSDFYRRGRRTLVGR